MLCLVKQQFNLIMRQLPKKQLHVRKITIGGATPLICIPLFEQYQSALFNAAHRLLPLAPDIIEWRIDAFEHLLDIDACLRALFQLRSILVEIPILLTCRRAQEGGLGKEEVLSEKNRLQLITQAIESGCIDLVDIELSSGEGLLEAVQQTAKKHKVRSIVSYHNFIETPSQEKMIGLLQKMEQRGADIAKLAVMPNCYQDVLRLLTATSIARTESLTIPMVTIAMGEEGKISRVAGGLFGSDITFAEGEGCSAPGQLPVTDMRKAMALLY